jgi:hypothetical protein
MSTASAAAASIAVLSIAGLLPAIVLIGPRLVAVPLLPLIGAVIASLAATLYTAVGGTFIGWFAALAIVGGFGIAVAWLHWPDRRPRWRPDGHDIPFRLSAVMIGIVAALAILGTCIYCLRALATPTVGFDARALWLMRAGWFLQPHQQLLIKMRVPDVVLTQSAYPPLVSATTALAWRITGDQSVRLGVVVVAILNTCALATAAWALVDAGRRASVRLSSRRPASRRRHSPLAPMIVGAVAATLLVFVSFGITEPFMTNGYADPIWSLAAVGALAFGLQLERSRTNQGVALILLLVAGMSKDEGVVTAALLAGLIAVRGVATLARHDRWRRWWRPVLLGGIELVAIAVWPVLMRVIHARGDSAPLSPASAFAARARASFHGMTPYLHVIVLAAPLALVGGMALSTVRRRCGIANDLWAWAGLACGLLAIGGAFVTGTGAIQPWLLSTVHRVTEFSALAGWWIVAMWAVVASGAPAATLRRGRHRTSSLRSGAPENTGPELSVHDGVLVPSAATAVE